MSKNMHEKKEKTLNIYNKILAIRGRSEFYTFRNFRQNFKIRKWKYNTPKLLKFCAFIHSISLRRYFSISKRVS